MRIALWTMIITDVLLTTTLPHDQWTNDDPHNLTKRKESDYFDKNDANKENESDDNGKSESYNKIDKRELDDAVDYGIRAMQELIEVKEPKWYKMGLYLDAKEPAHYVANFGAPIKKAIELSNFGYASLEATKRLAETYPENVSRQAAGSFDTRLREDVCPLRGTPRCPAASRRYRTADGTCNNFNKPWRGSSLLPMQRFLQPVYEDGIQEPRRSIFGHKLPSAREISTRIHRDKNFEVPTVSLMFMQWGQLIDHDLVSTVKSRSFNGTVPRCCRRGGQALLPPELTHPSCLPIEVSPDDWFLSSFGLRCIEFIRSAPSTRIDCDLGWREQINQVTSYLDASPIYGSDIETSDSMRVFRKGKLHYGRPQGREPLQPPDPPGGELCRSGAVTTDCFQGGDGRFSEQPGLTALHTVFVRYHNRLATVLGQVNRHWSDEKVYQETRRIVVAIMQHVTYREFLPIVLGPEVIDLFELKLERKGYYSGYDDRVNPEVANAFGSAAFRFGHSMVQNSFVRFDTKHRPLFNNVTLHEEQENVENIWSLGSLDRLLLGFCNQPSQRRDEFICDELTNHLFQSRGFPFGMDLAAINVQRGRDHGLPPYTSWREPCGLSPIKSWKDLEKIMNPDTVHRFESLYEDINDIDLFSGGLAEKPVRGGIIGPTFACIIAQQFLNLRKGDRFWYENGGFESSFTPAQLQQIRHVTLAHVLCQTLTEIETIQPFVFLTVDGFRNSRLSCDDPVIDNFDLSPWVEEDLNEVRREGRKRRKLKRTTTKKPKVATPVKVKVYNTTTHTVKVQTKQTYTDSYGNVPDNIPQRPTFDSYNDRRTTRPDVTYLFGVVSESTTPIPTPKPFQVNIKIQYYPPTTPQPTRRTRRPYDSTTKQNFYSDDYSVYRPQNYYQSKYEDQPFTSSKRPYIYSNNYVYSKRRPQDDAFDRLYSDVYSTPNFEDQDDLPRPFSHVEKFSTNYEHDKLDFYTPKKQSSGTKFVKISSVKGQEYLDPSGATVQLHVSQREGDLELDEGGTTDDVRLVDLEVLPGDSKWLVYNATEEEPDVMVLPDVNLNVSCSSELPRPFLRRNLTVPET
ncbi:chorion peroxidase isoform X1 [Tribolium castaneum]|uniref:Chorion peroxidase-like Protein n=2 Tax=Tribolium castaneum TaxID=7070 RepID=D2A572_TRICA|nr:PREDICTED: chorion peroxidase isoform X1 [Tribolium castaneum]EFA05698.1 Chorion peroxidase-like Protein [Tribolium castaneum]|eukprot:XP_008194602.1 PREDICTED: chorion peroxidase isoform X1 [Tribolium castaneum]